MRKERDNSFYIPELLVLVVYIVELFNSVKDLLGKAGKVEGTVSSVLATAPSVVSVSGVLAQEWVDDCN